MGFAPAGDIADILAAPPTPETLPFGEGFAAAYEAERQTSGSDSFAYQTEAMTRAALQRAADLGIDGNTSPYGPQIPAPELPRYPTTGALNGALDWLDGRRDAIAGYRSDAGGPPDPLLLTGTEIRQRAAEKAQAALAEASRAGIGARLAAGALAQAREPLNMAAMVVGAGAGEATLAARLAMEGAAFTASGEAIRAAARPAMETAGVLPTASQEAEGAAVNFLGGIAIGGALHGAGLLARRVGILDAYHGGVRDGSIIPTRETDNAAAAVQDAIDTVPPQGSPAAEAAHLDATGAAVDVLNGSGSPARLDAASQNYAAAASSVSEPRNVQIFRQVQDMTAEDLQQATAAARAADRQAPIDAFGEEGAKRYRQLLVAQESMDSARADAAAAEVSKMEESLSPDAYGRLVGAPGYEIPITAHEVAPFQSALSDIEGATAPQLAERLGYWITQLPPEGRPVAAWTQDQQVAAFSMRRIMQEAQSRGFDIQHLQTAAMRRAASRFPDPLDAEFMLRRFLPQEAEASHEAATAAQAVQDRNAGLAAHDVAVGALPEPRQIPVETISPENGAVIPAEPSLVTPEQSASVQAAVEANPDLAASYTDASGDTVTGRASDLIAAETEHRSILKQILDCVLAAPEAVD